MNKRLTTIAVAASLLAAASSTSFADEQSSSGSKNLYLGSGIGAIAGGLLAGPVGFIAGGAVGGGIAGNHTANAEAVPAMPADDAEVKHAEAAPQEPIQQASGKAGDDIVVARSGELDTVIDDTPVDQSSELQGILVSDMQLDILFLSGSTTLESYYKPRVQTVARIMEAMPQVNVYLDGYSDRRGDAETNLALSGKRLNAVRDELVQAGIDADRIHLNALGEQQFVSQAGDLEAYTFDRRVVIRFDYAASEQDTPLALVEKTPTQ